ncbi:NAD(P)H-dependent oxidoreductase [Zophobihabitans entericus]|uniref:NAD(P)H-dependent oxidoreductase n=1 Tax=Zophobihabitans entericus TaxID=1635327 RepID=A0A6G9IAP9_9GAMM|nr:NAD(P)H-dependent oxidoreductase [Zophobihabitans entericus]QIQ20899.1 NAD(P)H-dependent oxidoreductase [Zophobihabitans entericus]
MSNILIVNAAKSFAHSEGALNNFLSSVAQETLSELGHEVKRTDVDKGYDLEEEVGKFLWADTIIYQMPAWWMDMPWILKKYVDDVFTFGHGRMYNNDGRTRSDLSKKYGSGGMLQGRTYMLSVTWNAPLEAFVEANQFFEGKGVDSVYFPFHKANEFIGLKRLPTFMCNDVIKEPHVEQDAARYKAHLKSVFTTK